MKLRLWSLILIFFVLSSLVAAQELELPPAFQKIEEYNKQQADFYMQNLTFFIAFIAGMLSIFSPCLVSTLPAFFAYSFKERKGITKMTFVFFLGFTIVFVAFGLIASFIGQSLVGLQQNYSWLIIIAGIFLIVFGIITLAGKGFSSLIKPKKVSRNDTFGVFLFGFFFAIGWSACLGPILGGVLLMAAVLKTYFSAALLLFSYSMGIFVPLFILSFVFDKFNFARILSGKDVHFKVFNKEKSIHITNLIAGLLLIATGILFIIFRGTSFFNTLSIFGTTTELFYTLQREIINFKYVNIIGAVALIVFILVLWRFLKRLNKTEEK